MAESIYEQLIQSPAVRGFMQNHGLLGNPHVNIADQARLQDADGKRQQAVRAGAEYDKDTYKQLFKGLGKLTGIQSGPKTQAVGNFASNNLAKLAPYGEQLFPQTWNDLHGSRGSVATLAGAVQDTQPNDDPAAAAQTAGTIFKKLHNPFTGPGTSGLSTTHLGPLYKDMHARGLLGTKGGPNADNSAKQLGGMSGALRAMQDFQVAEKVSRALPALFKAAVSTNLIARTLASARSKGTLTPERAQKFEARMQNWIPNAQLRNRKVRDKVVGDMGSVPESFLETPKGGQKVIDNTVVNTTMKPQHVSNIADVYGRPPPVNIGIVDDISRAAYNAGSLNTTPDVAVLGHEMGHLAATKSDRRMYRAAFAPPRQSFLSKLFNKKEAPLKWDPQEGTVPIRMTLARERNANAAFRRASRVDDGKALGTALGVGSVSPEQVQKFTAAQLEDYKLHELAKGLGARQAARGHNIEVPETALKEKSFVTRKIMKNLGPTTKTAESEPLGKSAALGRVLGRSALFGLGGAALGIGASQLGRSTPRGGTSGANPPASMPSAVDPRGNWTGFKAIAPDVKEKLFQTRNYVNHPGFWEEAPAKPRLLRMLEEPETAAATRAAIRSGQA